MRRFAWVAGVCVLCGCARPELSAPQQVQSVQSARGVRAALARATTRHWLAQPTPVASEDLAALRKQWVYYARPESVVVQHLLLRVDARDVVPLEPPTALSGMLTEQAKRALRNMEKIRPSLVSLSDEAFAQQASQLAEGDKSFVFEPLPPFVADGRMVQLGPPALLAPAFVRAAWALKDGETSEPVLSPYGWHLIRRIETHPANMPSDAELAQQHAQSLANEAKKRRIEEGLSTLRATAHVEVAPAAESLLSRAAAVYAP